MKEYRSLREGLTDEKSLETLHRLAKDRGISLGKPPELDILLKRKGLGEPKDRLAVSIANVKAIRKLRRHLGEVGKYVRKAVRSIDPARPELHPVALVFLEIALSSGCDVVELVRHLLHGLDIGAHPVFHFMVLALYREQITLTLFSKKSRDSREEVDERLIKAYLKLVRGTGRKKKRGRPSMTIGDGKRELPLCLDDPDRAAISQRLGFSFLLQNSVSLHFTEDPVYRDDTLNSLMLMTGMLFPCQGEPDRRISDPWAFSHSLFLRVMILSAAGEDEKALLEFEALQNDGPEEGSERVPLPDLFYIASATQISATHSLTFDAKKALELSRKAAALFLYCSNQKELGQALVTVSDAARNTGDIITAGRAGLAAGELFINPKKPLHLASARTSLGWVSVEKGDHRAADRYFKKAGKEFARRSDLSGYTETMIGRLTVAFRRGKRRKAKRLLRQIALSLPVKQYPELFAILKEEAMQQEWLRDDRELGQMFEKGRPVRISRAVVQKIIKYAKDSYPNEFGAALVGSDMLEKLELLYSSSVNRNSVLFSKYDSAGTRITVDGFVHSHPSGAAIPSKADLYSFSLFVNNLIIGYPFTEESIAAYDRVGNRLELEIVD